MNFHQLISIIISTVLLSSCATQNLFRTESEGNILEILQTDSMYHHTIKVDDKISISIWNHDNMSVGSVFSIYNSNESYGKWILVDAAGQVKLPKIGDVLLGGFTCPAAAGKLKKLYEKFLVDPIIVVKVLNREVTVLGEVRTPGTYFLEKERNTISEIIGKAQGFDTYADFEKIQLVRKGISYTIDMTTLSLNMEHTLVIESGDIINVPSRKGKKLDLKAPTLIPFASATTAIAVIVSILLK